MFAVGLSWEGYLCFTWSLIPQGLTSLHREGLAGLPEPRAGEAICLWSPHSRYLLQVRVCHKLSQMPAGKQTPVLDGKRC